MAGTGLGIPASIGLSDVVGEYPGSGGGADRAGEYPSGPGGAGEYPAGGAEVEA